MNSFLDEKRNEKNEISLEHEKQGFREVLRSIEKGLLGILTGIQAQFFDEEEIQELINDMYFEYNIPEFEDYEIIKPTKKDSWSTLMKSLR